MLNYCPQCGLNLSEFYGWFRCWRCHRWFDQSLVEIDPDSRRQPAHTGKVCHQQPMVKRSHVDNIIAK